jgi:hypothetical protein
MLIIEVTIKSATAGTYLRHVNIAPCVKTRGGSAYFPFLLTIDCDSGVLTVWG